MHPEIREWAKLLLWAVLGTLYLVMLIQPEAAGAFEP